MRSSGVVGTELLGRHEVASGDDVAELRAPGGRRGERGQRSRELWGCSCEMPRRSCRRCAGPGRRASVRLGRARAQAWALWSSTTASGSMPDATSSIRSSSSRASSAGRSRSPGEVRRAQTPVERLEAGPVAARAPGHDLLPSQAFEASQIWASRGPVTRISRTSSRNGGEKSTMLWRSGVMVRLAAAMSPLPSDEAGSRSSRVTGTNTTRIGRAPVWKRRLSRRSNSAPTRRPAPWARRVEIVVGAVGHDAASGPAGA